MGRVFPSVANRPLSSSARAQDMSICRRGQRTSEMCHQVINKVKRSYRESTVSVFFGGISGIRSLRINAQKFRAKVGHSQKTNLPSFLLYREI